MGANKGVIDLGSIRLENVDPKLHRAFRILCIKHFTSMQAKLKQMMADEVKKAQRAKRDKKRFIK